MLALCHVLLLTLLGSSAALRHKVVRHLPSAAGIPRSQRLRVRLREKLAAQEENLRAVLSPEQLRAVQAPITVAIMSTHYFGSDYARDIDDCKLADVPLNCSFLPTTDQKSKDTFNVTSATENADAVWWHAPTICSMQVGVWHKPWNKTFSTFKARPDQIAILASMESSTYYTCLDFEYWMKNFDLEMTYRQSSQVQLLYWNNGYKDAWEARPPLPPDQKREAVAFMNSNCQPASDRTRIVEELREQPGITVDALGRCLNEGNVTPAGAGNKQETFRKYKYCIAMENSIAQDYVTEKVYDALAAGCLPIYLGAPNIEDYVPTPDAIIDYAKLGSVEALAEELRRLSADNEAYTAHFRWRDQPETWGKRFQDIVETAAADVHTQCRVCQTIARHRVGLPEPSTGKPFRLQPPRQASESDKKRIRGEPLFDIKHELAAAPHGTEKFELIV